MIKLSNCLTQNICILTYIIKKILRTCCLLMNAQLKKELQRADIHAEFNLSWVHTRALIGVPPPIFLNV